MSTKYVLALDQGTTSSRAILDAACELKKEGYNPCPEIMVPLIGTVQELKQQKSIILATSKEVFAEFWKAMTEPSVASSIVEV